MNNIHNLALDGLYPFFLCFARVLGLIMMAPIFSQKEIVSQGKVMLAVTLSIFLTPLVSKFLPVTTELNQINILYLMLLEFGMGAFIGLSAKVLFFLIDILGHIIGMESGLSSAMLFNPSSGSQTMLPTLSLTVGAVVLLFSANFHHTLIQVLYHSYEFIDIHQVGVLADFKISLLDSFQKMFSLGLQFAYPFIIVALILNFSIGLLNKIIPQIQVFSIIMPAQVFVGFFMMAMLIGHLLNGFNVVFSENFVKIFQKR